MHFGNQPLPEGQRLGVRVVHAENLHPLLDPADDDVAQLHPETGDRFNGIEIDVDDVLVFLRRVLRVFDRAVGAPVEPARMLFEPRVVLGTLDGEVEGDFQPILRRCGHQSTEVFAGAQLRVNRFVPALLAANGIGAARIVRSCGQ
ncbi:hypothetical protein D3C87_1141810 [compost metagenome]